MIKIRAVKILAIRILAAILLGSAAAMTAAAATGDKTLSGAAAAIAAIAIAAAPLAPSAWRGLALPAARRDALLAAMLYAWGAAAMLGVYGLSGLSWRHGWQYGCAMALVAAGLYAYARQPSPPRHAFSLAAAHGLLAASALVFLWTSGKLWAGKPDWAANQIFVAGSLAILALCLNSARTEMTHSRGET